MARPRYFRYDVFLSHNQADGSIDFCRKLAQREVAVWHDGDADMREMAVHRSVAAAIDDSRFICVCVGSSFRDSEWVRAEYSHALKTNRVIVAEFAADAPVPEALAGQRRFRLHEGRLNDLVAFLLAVNARKPGELDKISLEAKITTAELEGLRRHTLDLRKIVLSRDAARKLQLGHDIALPVSPAEKSKLEYEYRSQIIRKELTAALAIMHSQTLLKASGGDGLWTKLVTARSVNTLVPRDVAAGGRPKKKIKGAPVSSERLYQRPSGAPRPLAGALNVDTINEFVGQRDQALIGLYLEVLEALVKRPAFLRNITKSSIDPGHTPRGRFPLTPAMELLRSDLEQDRARVVYNDLLNAISDIIGDDLTQHYRERGEHIAGKASHTTLYRGMSWHDASDALWADYDKRRRFRRRVIGWLVIATLCLMVIVFVSYRA